MSEYDSEPIRGLPEALPAGEAILWQGQPRAMDLARRALLAPYVAVYFAILASWNGAAAMSQGADAWTVIWSTGLLVVLGIAAIAILAAVAWAMQRTTIYTITNRRVVLRYGIALPMAVNIPFNEIEAAGLRTYRDGSGDISLLTAQRGGLAYFYLWPHVRPWRVARAEPTLRAIPDAEMVSARLGHALAASAALPVPAEAARRAPVTRPNTDWQVGASRPLPEGIGANS